MTEREGERRGIDSEKRETKRVRKRKREREKRVKQTEGREKGKKEGESNRFLYRPCHSMVVEWL